MHGASKAKTPKAYIAELDEPRRSEIAKLDALIRKTVPKLTPHIQGGILAYGPMHYKTRSGRESEWFKIGIANHDPKALKELMRLTEKTGYGV